MEPDIIEISEIDFDNNTGGQRSSNFGGGLEFLMNDKLKTSSTSNGDINIDDLNNLENELNDLADSANMYEGESVSHTSKSDLFSSRPMSLRFDEDRPSGVRFDDSINIGTATASDSNGDAKTWDGYGKFNDIPINPDKAVPTHPQMTKEELLREKFKVLKKLEALERKGVDLSKKYNMESSLSEMQGEYETIMDEKSKDNAVKFQGQMMMAIVNGIEFLNNRYDPFDIKLDGWGEQVNENVNDYDEIFAELYEKYKSRAAVAPELKLLFQLGGSAMMVHMSNTMFKSALPGMDDILRQNPDLMRQFQNAAVNSMSQTNPGFSGFMSGIMNPPTNSGPPPPMATQGPNAVPPPYGRAGNSNYSTRPDLRMGRQDDGINLRENFASSDPGPEKSSRRPPPPSEQARPPIRQEMKGPSDISDILSGLKTKTINIQEPPQTNNDSSTISISDLKELQNGGSMPKRSKRKQKSDKNTVSLDI